MSLDTELFSDITIAQVIYVGDRACESHWWRSFVAKAGGQPSEDPAAHEGARMVGGTVCGRYGWARFYCDPADGYVPCANRTSSGGRPRVGDTPWVHHCDHLVGRVHRSSDSGACP